MWTSNIPGVKDKDSPISNSMSSFISFFALNAFSLAGLIITYRLTLKILSNSIFVSPTWHMGEFTKEIVINKQVQLQ